MKSLTGKTLSLIALAGMILPAQAFEQPAAVPTATITDVCLTPQGELQGLVVRQNGQPVAGEVVRVMHNSKVVAAARTDARGRYTVKGLRPGTHKVSALRGEQVCRLWQAQTAPPAAKKGLISTESQRLVRGQDGGFEIGTAELVGLTIFGGVAAVTLATTLDGDDDVAAPASP